MPRTLLVRISSTLSYASCTYWNAHRKQAVTGSRRLSHHHAQGEMMYSLEIGFQHHAYKLVMASRRVHHLPISCLATWMHELAEYLLPRRIVCSSSKSCAIKSKQIKFSPDFLFSVHVPGAASTKGKKLPVVVWFHGGG